MTAPAARLFGGPTAAPNVFPLPGHRTVADVDAERRADANRAEIMRVHSPFYVAPVAPDRTPCARCGVRYDIGCHHRVAAGAA